MKLKISTSPTYFKNLRKNINYFRKGKKQPDFTTELIKLTA